MGRDSLRTVGSQWDTAIDDEWHAVKSRAGGARYVGATVGVQLGVIGAAWQHGCGARGWRGATDSELLLLLLIVRRAALS